MPIITTSFGILIVASLMPAFAAVSTIMANPYRIEGFTALGALVSMFLALAYLRIQAPQLGNNFWYTGFTCVSTFFIGWTLPEPLAWSLVNYGWLKPETVESFPLKMWSVASLACGLAGTTLVLYTMLWVRHRLPGKLDEVTSIARMPISSTTDLEMRTVPKSMATNSPTTSVQLPEDDLPPPAT